MIPKRKHHQQQEDHVDSWLMSYADMITLLLAFFIIFISTSEPKHDKLAAATRGMQERFGSVSMESPFDGVYRNVAGVVTNRASDRYVAIEKTGRGMKMELSAQQFFEPGSATMPEDKKILLDEVATALKAGDLVNYGIAIEGHASDATLLGPGFASLWELSSARAIAVLNVLAEQGVKLQNLHTASYADQQPMLPNKDAEGNAIPANQARNERIVINVERIEK